MRYKFNTIHPLASGVIDKARPMYRADILRADGLDCVKDRNYPPYRQIIGNEIGVRGELSLPAYANL